MLVVLCEGLVVYSLITRSDTVVEERNGNVVHLMGIKLGSGQWWKLLLAATAAIKKSDIVLLWTGMFTSIRWTADWPG